MKAANRILDADELFLLCVSDLKVVEIPDDVEWEIEEYDGNEWVSEVHRCWS